jgi:hypothetical protein
LNPSGNVVTYIHGPDQNDNGSSYSGSSLPITRGVDHGIDDVRGDRRESFPNIYVCIDRDISVNNRIRRFVSKPANTDSPLEADKK